MKRLLFVTLIAFALTSCATVQGYKDTVIVDYKSYYDEGFFITESNSVNFDYTPIGSVSTEVKGYKREESTQNQTVRSRRGRSARAQYSNQPYTIYDAIDELMAKSREIGADGVINLNIEYTTDKNFGNGCIVSGMAIKRKQK